MDDRCSCHNSERTCYVIGEKPVNSTTWNIGYVVYTYIFKYTCIYFQRGFIFLYGRIIYFERFLVCNSFLHIHLLLYIFNFCFDYHSQFLPFSVFFFIGSRNKSTQEVKGAQITQRVTLPLDNFLEPFQEKLVERSLESLFASNPAFPSVVAIVVGQQMYKGQILVREMDDKGRVTIIAPFPGSEDFQDPEVDDFVTDQDDDEYWDSEDPDSWTELPNPNPPASSPQNDPAMTIYNPISKGTSISPKNFIERTPALLPMNRRYLRIFTSVFLFYLLLNLACFNIHTDTQIIAQVKVIARKADVGSGILVEILDKDETYTAILELIRIRFFGGNTALTILPSTFLSHPVDTTASACSSGLLDMYVLFITILSRLTVNKGFNRGVFTSGLYYKFIFSSFPLPFSHSARRRILTVEALIALLAV